MYDMLLDALRRLPVPPDALRVGIDVVDVREVAASLQTFGLRYARRLYTEHELTSAGGQPQRLAARFAAKEAAVKAFGWAEAGVNLRDIEVRTDADGAPSLMLHARARALAAAAGTGAIELSLSHDGDHACAVVAALARPPSRD